MKKVILIFLSLVTAIVLCSCFSEDSKVIINNDKSIANENFKEIIKAISSNNKENIIAMFSKNVTQNNRTFNQSVDELIEYFAGTATSYNKDGGALYVEKFKENNQSFYAMESSYIVESTEGKYQFSVYYIAENNANINSIGIQSLYILKLDDEAELNYPYWGDGKNTPGINIGVTDS